MHALRLDHLTVIAPTLSEGVEHIRESLDVDVPFGARHHYMGTHNHRVQLGDGVYLEVVAVDPDGKAPPRNRWFGLDDARALRRHWDAGRRLRGWVASTTRMDDVIGDHPGVFGEMVALPFDAPTFDFSLRGDGALPLDGLAPSMIDHRDDPTDLRAIPDLGARLVSYTIETPEPDAAERLYDALNIDRPPTVVYGATLRYTAVIETPSGRRTLT